jgi:hypothetical protein
MLEKTISKQELLSDFDAAGNAAKEHAVFVTQSGEPAFVLLTIENYDRIVRGETTVYEAFARNGVRGEAVEYDLSQPCAENETLARAS